jgi:endo-1,4-beta-xylanase
MRFNFKRQPDAVIALLVCLIVLLPLYAFAQPLAKGKAKFLGGATSSNLFSNFDKYWNQTTPGNDGKWGSVEAVQGQPNWTNLDKIYDYAVQRGIQFKEHTLVWGSQQPAWIASLDSAGQRAAVENWIRLVEERYPSMAMVDVVNEPFHAPPSYKRALGGDGATGWDWVITAFQIAKKYRVPGVKLLINEYNIVHSTTVTTNYLALIKLLQDRGLIDGIGVQGHYFEFRSDIGSPNTYVYDIATIKSNLNRLTATGLPVYISEFDIDEPNDANQLAQYKIYFPIFWSNPGVKGITLWGYIQNDVWTAHPNTYVLLANGTERPALQWMRTFVLTPLTPGLISPVGTTGEPRNPLLAWHASASAKSYHVQVATNTGFTPVVVDTTVADTLLRLNPLEANRRFYWRVSAVNEYGASEYSLTAGFITGDQISAVEELTTIPTAFKLYQNYPNPFNPATTIDYSVARTGFVQLRIYDLMGREITTLVDQRMPAGKHTVRFEANALQSGIYVYQLQVGGFVESKKMIVLE